MATNPSFALLDTHRSVRHVGKLLVQCMSGARPFSSATHKNRLQFGDSTLASSDLNISAKTLTRQVMLLFIINNVIISGM